MNNIFAKKILLSALILMIVLGSFPTAIAQGTWTQKADFGGTARYLGAGFGIGSRVYMGMGWNNSISYSDFWEYDPAMGVWSQKANYPGLNKFSHTGFAIGTKGYVGGGRTSLTAVSTLFYEYDAISNVWTQKANIGGAARQNLVSFALNGKGYVGMGSNMSSVNFDVFHEYNPATDTWTQKATFPGGARLYAAGFRVANKGYVGTGYSPGGPNYYDLWEFDPVADSWLQKTGCPGSALYGQVSFSLSNAGYFIGGRNLSTNPVSEVWKYIPATDTWTQDTNWPVWRIIPLTVSLNDKGYLGTGALTGGAGFLRDFWEFDPNNTSAINEPESFGSISVYPNPAVDKIHIKVEKGSSLEIEKEPVSIYNTAGLLVRSLPFTETIYLNDLDNGVYYLKLKQNQQQHKIVISR